MPASRIRYVVAATLAVVGTAILLGTTGVTKGASPVQPGDSAESPVNTKGPDIIRIASPYRTTTLDPIVSWNSGNIETIGQLYSRLLRRDKANVLQPGLARRWEVSPDGTEYTFFLRVAQFSDGSPITADDVAFSFLRMRDDPEAVYPGSVSYVLSAVAVDARTVRFKLKEPNAPFLDTVESYYLGIVSKADVERRGKAGAFTNPLTSGPYRVAQWKPNDRIVLEANPHYWRASFLRNSGVELIEVTDVNTRLAMMQTGEVDAVRAILWSQAVSLKASGLARVPHEPANMIWVILLNHSRPPFDDLRVRQAAVLALDRALIVAVSSRGLSQVANTTLPATLSYHYDSYPGWPYDPDRARQLVEAAGATGKEVLINFAAPDASTEFFALVLQAYWSEIGLKVRVEKVDQVLDEQRTEDGEYDASINWWYNENPDPDQAVRWALCGSCGTRSYYTGYQNDEVDRLTTEGARTLDAEKRRAIYYRIQEISTAEVAQIPISYPPWLNAYSPRIEGLTFTPANQWTLENARHVP